MVESCKPGPLNPPIKVGLKPARTRGPLGIFDQGDSEITTLLGNSQGPLGFNDLASVNLPVINADVFRFHGTPCRLPDGTALSIGRKTDPTIVKESTNFITVALLRAADNSNNEEYYKTIVDSLNEFAKTYAVNTPLRIAHFLAQIAHESHLRSIEENGKYSAKRMREIFGCKGGKKNYNKATDDSINGTIGRLRPKLWDEENKYANNPKNLLSFVYASRSSLGNGDEASGDGYTYRGRGMMQLTGKANYSAFTIAHNKKSPNDEQDFVANPDLVFTNKSYGVESAFYFWDSKKLNSIADEDDVEKVTIKVNGGTNGIDDRKAHLLKLKQMLGIV